MSAGTVDIDAVTAILKEAAATAIVPRFRALSAGEVGEKAPGEVVTVADREAEQLITRRLRGLLDVPVVGEEATSDHPSLVEAVREAPLCWLVDPLDGTSNFVAGREAYAVMAALVRDGEAVASWIYRPQQDTAYTAELGSGAWREGVRLRRPPAPQAVSELRGSALTGFMEAADRARVAEVAPRFAALGPGSRCAGVDYPLLAEGAQDFVLFRRTLPWDHAPGALLLTEAGGVALRPDGTRYSPAVDCLGLLNAADEVCWKTVRALLPA